MFKKTTPSQVDLFKNVLNQLSKRKQKLLNDPSSWHHIFYTEVICRIDESVFSVLFDGEIGRPNASIRVLIGMMILKSGNGWSDEQLFEECRFNIRVMLALGLVHLDDDVPVESSYYKFRASLLKYEQVNEIDLLALCFAGITSQQISVHNVSGKKVRMDSKLIHSNIAKCSRLELILEGIRVFIHPLNVEELNGLLEQESYDLLLKLKKKTTTNITYQLDKTAQELLLVDLGSVLQTLLNHYRTNPGLHYTTLQRIYEDHYKVLDSVVESTDNEHTNKQDEEDPPSDSIVLKPAKEVSSSSVQSPHDPESTYRCKGKGNSKQMIAGYHVNITETCDEENKLNLITDVIVTTANVSEDSFLTAAVEASEEVLQQARQQSHSINESEGGADDSAIEQTSSPGLLRNAIDPIIEEVDSDGGYDSIYNRFKIAILLGLQWNIRKMKGANLRFTFSFDESEQLQAIDNKTGESCQVTYLPDKDKYRVSYQDKNKTKRRYFTEEELFDYLLIQEIKDAQTADGHKRRANVEATIHQCFHRLLKRNKMKYRGRYKCTMYAFSRALWSNFRRILQKTELNIDFFLFWLLMELTKVENRNVVFLKKNQTTLL